MRPLTVVKLALVSLAACGGDDDSVECPAFSACGGDPAGEWDIVGTCVDEPVFESGGIVCAGQGTLAFQDDLSASGTLSLDSGGSYAVEQNLRGTLVLSLPLSCLEDEGFTCDEVAKAVAAECAAVGSACECEDTFDRDAEETGTWETDGGRITFSEPGNGAVGNGEFCADGDRLELRSPDTDLGVASTLFLERR
jgi:hypothetical protein